MRSKTRNADLPKGFGEKDFPQAVSEKKTRAKRTNRGKRGHNPKVWG
jgi:hypothetical protein